MLQYIEGDQMTQSYPFTTTAIPIATFNTIRLATAADVPGIAALVEQQARLGNLLPRTPEAIEASLSDWLVAVVPRGGQSQVIGCVQLLAYPSRLVEVRSLAVAHQAQGLGVGGRLMLALLAEARQRQVPTLFALTRAVPFFQRFGFTVTEHSHFPEKVWRDCRLCPLRERCDEVAMVREVVSGK